MMPRILIIEDSRPDSLTERVFAQGRTVLTDAEIESAFNLTDGLLRLREVHFDAVVLDLGLPESFGIETLMTLRKEFPEVGVVVVTGSVDMKVWEQCIKKGHEYLSKVPQGNMIMLPNLLQQSIWRAEEQVTRKGV